MKYLVSYTTDNGYTCSCCRTTYDNETTLNSLDEVINFLVNLQTEESDWTYYVSSVIRKVEEINDEEKDRITNKVNLLVQQTKIQKEQEAKKNSLKEELEELNSSIESLIEELKEKKSILNETGISQYEKEIKDLKLQRDKKQNEYDQS